MLINNARCLIYYIINSALHYIEKINLSWNSQSHSFPYQHHQGSSSTKAWHCSTLLVSQFSIHQSSPGPKYWWCWIWQRTNCDPWANFPFQGGEWIMLFWLSLLLNHSPLQCSQRRWCGHRGGSGDHICASCSKESVPKTQSRRHLNWQWISSGGRAKCYWEGNQVGFSTVGKIT